MRHLKALYPQYTYEIVSIYMLIFATVISSIIGAIKLKKKTELLWGSLFVGWGLIMSMYTSYHGNLLACIKIAPLLGYCLRGICRSEQHTTSDKRSVT